MLSELCGELRNWFIKSPCDIHRGKFTVKNGSIDGLEFLQEGQYFRVVGSVFNDERVWQHPESSMTDETFCGEIWAMRVPQAVIDLSNEIDTWVADHANAINSPYQSESFGGYSYSKGYVGGNDGGAQGVTWQGQFASKLSRWRKL